LGNPEQVLLLDPEHPATVVRHKPPAASFVGLSKKPCLRELKDTGVL